MSRVRVLLADDHEGVLARLRTVLNEEFEVVGALRNGRDAVEEVQRLDPDVLVIDICMPILDGLRAAAQLSSNCRTKIVFLTLHEAPRFRCSCFFCRSLGLCSEVGNGYRHRSRYPRSCSGTQIPIAGFYGRSMVA